MWGGSCAPGRAVPNGTLIDPKLDKAKCCAACNRRPKCVGWTLNKKTKSCILKADISNASNWLTHNNLVGSGIKYKPVKALEDMCLGGKSDFEKWIAVSKELL